jgi:hypothetical protein
VLATGAGRTAATTDDVRPSGFCTPRDTCGGDHFLWFLVARRKTLQAVGANGSALRTPTLCRAGAALQYAVVVGAAFDRCTCAAVAAVLVSGPVTIMSIVALAAFLVNQQSNLVGCCCAVCFRLVVSPVVSHKACHVCMGSAAGHLFSGPYRVSAAHASCLLAHCGRAC